MKNMPMEGFMSNVNTRESFIRKTYTYLALSILAFAVLEYFFLISGVSQTILELIIKTGWLPFLGAFMLLSWLATSIANNASSKMSQHLGLAFYIILEALIFAPIILLALLKTGDAQILLHAAALTGVMTLALTGVAFTSGKNFSFLGSFLKVGGIVAIGLIISGALFGFTLGIWFVGAMILFASGTILYSTSNIIHEYREDQHVMAALSLFASIALLFWYILQFFMSRD